MGIDRESGKPLMVYFDSTMSGVGAKARTDWLIKQLSKINLQLVMRSTDYNRFQEKMRKGTEQLYYWGWNADYPDPENFLFLFYGPQGKVKFSGENASNYANPQFDRLFERMREMENSPAREAVVAEMTRDPAARCAVGMGLLPEGFRTGPSVGVQPQAQQDGQQHPEVPAHRPDPARAPARRVEPARDLAASRCWRWRHRPAVAGGGAVSAARAGWRVVTGGGPGTAGRTRERQQWSSI